MKQKKLLKLVLLLSLIGLISFIIFFSLSKQPEPPLQVSLKTENPVEIGFVSIELVSNKPLSSTQVKVGGETAEFVSKKDNTYLFKGFVSPYEASGNRKVEAYFQASNGEKGEAFADLNVSFAQGELVNGIAFYYHASPPSQDEPNKTYEFPSVLASKLVSGKKVFFFFESDEQSTERNSLIITAFGNFIRDLNSKGISTETYAFKKSEGQTVECLNPDGQTTPISECEALLEKGPSILLKLPVYPTTQVEVKDKVIKVKSTQEDLKPVLTTLSQVLTQEGAPVVTLPSNQGQ
jgi:hypothetical protein